MAKELQRVHVPKAPRASFNDGTELVPNQCVAFKRTCPDCGERFGAHASCPRCGFQRPRCSNRAMRNEIVCRVHVVGRAYSAYKKLASQIGDIVLDEFIETSDSKDTNQEFALARIALSAALDEGNIKSKDLMEMTKTFFDIALTKKKLEEGDLVKVKWDDALVNQMRQYIKGFMRNVVNFMRNNEGDVINQDMIDNMLRASKKDLLLVGNRVTTGSRKCLSSSISTIQ